MASNVRIIRLPCTGRIDPLFIIKAFERGADAVIVSGCHPADCHYTSGNYHARRRFAVFHDIMQFFGVDEGRMTFSWVSASEGAKWRDVVNEAVAKARELGPFTAYRALAPEGIALGRGAGSRRRSRPGRPPGRPWRRSRHEGAAGPRPHGCSTDNEVEVVLGWEDGRRGARPVFVTDPADADKLIFDTRCVHNLATYLNPRRQQITALGKPALVVKGCDVKAVAGLLRESQLDARATSCSSACAAAACWRKRSFPRPRRSPPRRWRRAATAATTASRTCSTISSARRSRSRRRRR